MDSNTRGVSSKRLGSPELAWRAIVKLQEPEANWDGREDIGYQYNGCLEAMRYQAHNTLHVNIEA